jgi:parvulin-like peptidyl-prolyl isomerase
MFDKFKKKQKTTLGRVGRVEREQRLIQVVRYSTIAIIGIVIIVTLGGVIMNSFILPSQPIATVNGQEIMTDDFQTRVQIERDNLLLQYEQFLNAYYTATDTNLQSTYQNYLAQLQSQMEPDIVGQSIMSQMVDEILLMDYAQSIGIEVTEDEVTNYIYEIFGYYPDGAPEPTEAPTALPTSTLTDEQLAIITPTPLPEEDGSEEEVEPTALPSVDVPETTSVTKEEYEESLNTYLDGIKEWGGDEELLRHLVRVQIYTDRINAELIKDIDPRQEQVWARHILVDDEETALDLLDQIDNDYDFGVLAQEYSTDTGSAARNGDLGWFGRGAMVPEFEEAAFNAEIGEVVGPVQSQYGYHLIQVLGHELRPMSQSELNTQAQAALSELLASLLAEADVEYADNWTERVPTKPDIFDIQTS